MQESVHPAGIRSEEQAKPGRLGSEDWIAVEPGDGEDAMRCDAVRVASANALTFSREPRGGPGIGPVGVDIQVRSKV